MLFSELHLIDPLLRALADEGYTQPTPIQEASIPYVLAGRDLLGIAQTGTGKTASFALPMIQRLSEKNMQTGDFQKGSISSAERVPEGAVYGTYGEGGTEGKARKTSFSKSHRPIRALILTPTRELAIQIQESFASYGRYANLRSQVIFGGVSQHSQVNALEKGIDILIATPGRLLDLMQQGFVDLRNIEFFVLDEADRMLDMGFVNDVKKILQKIPTKRQTLFFSATMPTAIIELSRSMLTNPAKVEVTPASTTAEKISQSVYFVHKNDKKDLLKDILKDKTIDRVLVFTRTKHGADKVVKDLDLARIPARAIHGNKSQNNRQAALAGFKNKELRVLVATDIAARGIDIDDLTHVINFELPNVSESYVHRIGRTGRAGTSGIAIAFCDAEEKSYLRDIEKLIAQKIRVIEDHGYPLTDTPEKHTPAKPQSTGRFERTKSSFQKPKVEHRKGQNTESRGEPRVYAKPSFDSTKTPEKTWSNRPLEREAREYPKRGDDRAKTSTPKTYPVKKEFSKKSDETYDDGTPRPGEKLSWRKNTKRSERSFSKNKSAEYEAKKWHDERPKNIEKKLPSPPKEPIEKSHPPKAPRTRPGARKSNPKPFIASAPKGAKKV